MSQDLYRPIYTDIRKVKDVEPESAVRVYCTQSNGGVGQAWCLQVRGKLKLVGRGEGKDFIVASGSLDREDMKALRDVCDAFLVETDT